MKEVIATLATEKGVKPEALRKWVERGRVPHKERITLIEMAQKRDLPLSTRDFDFKPKKKRKAA